MLTLNAPQWFYIAIVVVWAYIVLLCTVLAIWILRSKGR